MCRLVRSSWGAREVGHAWNEVKVDGQYYIVDAMFAPGDLIPLSSPAAHKYTRLELPEPLQAAEVSGFVALEELQFETQQIDLDAALGSGSFAIVRKAVWRNVEVAVKQPKVHCFQANQLKQVKLIIVEEIEKHRQLVHPNIVLFMGANRAEHLIVTELMAVSLEKVLYDDAWARRDGTAWGESHMALLGIAADAAKGAQYLHTRRPAMFHGDIKPANILLSSHVLSRATAKLADFGSAKDLNRTATTLTQKTAVYTPCDTLFNDRSDCYSLGVVLWEMTTGLLPWEERSPAKLEPKKVERALQVSNRPSVAVVELFKAGLLNKNRDARPTSMDVVNRLGAALREEGSSH